MVLSPARPARDRRASGDDGIVLILFALALTAILILAALVIDLGDSRQTSRQAQASSDAAALAGAQYLPLDAPDTTAASQAKAKAAAYAANNILGAISAPTSASCPGGVPANSSCYTVEGATITVATPYQSNFGLIYVSVCTGTEPFFGKVVDSEGTTICREAVARRYAGQTIEGAGVIALRQGAGCVDYDMRGSGGAVLSVTGAVIANCEASPPNNFAGSNAEIDATGFYSVGSCATQAACVGSGAATPTIHLDAPISDPLAGLPEPPVGAPGFTQLSVSSYNALGCLDGLYRVTGTGNIDVKSTCPGATAFTFVVDAGMGGPPGLKAPYEQFPPTSGTYAGISLFFARDNDSLIEWNGNAHSSATYHGTVYAPAGHVEWGGNIDVLIVGQVIAQDYYLHGGGGDKNLGFAVDPPDDVAPIRFDDDLGLEL